MCPFCIYVVSVRISAPTFCCVEHSSRFPPTSLPVNAVGQRADEILLTALHDLLSHLVKLLGVVDPTVELGVGIGEL